MGDGSQCWPKGLATRSSLVALAGCGGDRSQVTGSGGVHGTETGDIGRV